MVEIVSLQEAARRAKDVARLGQMGGGWIRLRLGGREIDVPFFPAGGVPPGYERLLSADVAVAVEYAWDVVGSLGRAEVALAADDDPRYASVLIRRV